MKTTSLIATALLATVFALPAVAAETTAINKRAVRTTTTTTRTVPMAANDRGFYIAGQAGLNIPTRDGGALDNDAVYAGALGYRFNPNFRLEGEGSYRQNDGSETIDGIFVTGETKVTTAMLNAYYDFKNRSLLTPYVGIGAGFAYGTLDASAPGVSADFTDNAFAWQGIAGVSYDVMPKLALTADYRYLDTARFDDIGDDYSAHEVRAGLRYSF